MPGNACNAGRKLNFCRLFISENEWTISIISWVLGGINGSIMTYFNLENFLASLRSIIKTRFLQMKSIGIWHCEIDRQLNCPQFEIILKTLGYAWLKSFMLRLSSRHDLRVLSVTGLFKNVMSLVSRQQS